MASAIPGPVQLRLIKPDTGSFQRYIIAFLATREAAGRSPATLGFYRVLLDELSAFAAAAWPPSPGDLSAFFLALRRAGRKPATLVTYYGALKVFFGWCVAQGSLAENPLERVARPKQATRLPRAIPRPVLQLIFAAIEKEAAAGDALAIRDYALFRLIYDGGLRSGEACSLQWPALDLEYNSVVVMGKTGERVVYFGNATRAALVRWRDTLHSTCGALFPSIRGTPLTGSGARRAWQRWCERAGVQRYRVHDLRHSYARHALQAGIDPEMVSRQLGHANPGFTLRVYGRSRDEDRRRVHLRLAPGDHLREVP
jgi:integrase/recombinase XerC/integrase/recombinase XerD